MTTKAELQKLFFTKLLEKYEYDSTELLKSIFFDIYYNVIVETWKMIREDAIDKKYEKHCKIADIKFKYFEDAVWCSKITIVLENGFEHDFRKNNKIHISQYTFQSCLLYNHLRNMK